MRKQKVDQYFLTHRKKFELVDPEGKRLMKNFVLSNYYLFCSFVEYFQKRLTLSELMEKNQTRKIKKVGTDGRYPTTGRMIWKH